MRAVVFSGGEPTLQGGPALAHLAAAARKMGGFSVGLHTNGIFPGGVIEDLLAQHLST